MAVALISEDLKDMIGLPVLGVAGLEKDSKYVVLNHGKGKVSVFQHHQDCCECVTLEDFEGDASDLVGGIVVDARKEVSARPPEALLTGQQSNAESETWTFYHIDTNKGTLWLRWYGSSNGYYSEEVSYALVDLRSVDECASYKGSLSTETKKLLLEAGVAPLYLVD